MTRIQTFTDGSELRFDNGCFDNWCVYLKRPNQPIYAPTDIQYFTQLYQFGEIHGHNKIYNDFVTYYIPTSGNTDTLVLDLIRQISQTYINDALEIEILFTIIYAGMIAKENKKFAILKKRIKRLGMHQMLIDRLSPEIVANYSRGKSWRELDQICKSKGF